MDPFSSFDLFRRRVDQMFADFDQQMFGQQQPQQTIGLEKQPQQGGIPAKEEEERIVPHTTSDRSLFTRPTSALSLFNWPTTTMPSMKLDVVEEKDKYLIHADVPGFKKDQIKLNIQNGMLSVSGETSKEKEEMDPDRRYHRVERSSGSIYRSIPLPQHIKEDEITATCENGVLKVVLPKEQIKEEKKERQITIQ